MIYGAVDMLFDWVEQLEGVIPNWSYTAPDISGVVTQINALATALLPWSEIKNALLIALMFWGIRIAMIPVRWALIAGRGVNPG